MHSTSDSADPQKSDTEMLTDEQYQEIRKKNREKKDLPATGFVCR